MNVKLHIERLVLDGFPLTARQGAEVREAVQAELTRLMTETSIHPELQQSQSIPKLRADPLHTTSNAAPRTLGVKIARSVYGGVGPPR
jgi:hypothetical protein